MPTLRQNLVESQHAPSKAVWLGPYREMGTQSSLLQLTKDCRLCGECRVLSKKWLKFFH